VALAAMAQPALAEEAADASAQAAEGAAPAKAGSFTTGVAKGRDLLDSAISASTIDAERIARLAPLSFGALLSNIPGVRADSALSQSNITIRGLPMSTTGAKFLQLEENGLPVLEFGDIMNATADSFIRADLNVAQVQSIRGGSASTFASNSPGGIINLIDATGEVTGGAIQASSGLNYKEHRVDFTYGHKVDDTLRYQVGGFWHTGVGLRQVGYDGVKGGQIKFNITKSFTGGYLRLYLKFLDDRTPGLAPTPIQTTGTNADPRYVSLPGFDARYGALLSANIANNVILGQNNTVTSDPFSEGMHFKSKSVGLEGSVDLAGWTVTDRFRAAFNSGSIITNYPARFGPAQAFADSLGGAGSIISYASGPRAGQVITSPSTLNGNGLLMGAQVVDARFNSLDNITNDLRASRVWKVGGGDLTTTAGFYKSRQTIDAFLSYSSLVTDLADGGRASLINITRADGTPVTQNGNYAFNGAYFYFAPPERYKVNYDTNAAFGSVNFHRGKVAIGGSLRYDFGSARGSQIGAALGGGRVGMTSFDMNGDSVLRGPEFLVGILPLSQPAPVNYNFHYLSWSTGINYRLSDGLAVFARYSRGGRANSDRMLFTSLLNTTTGGLNDTKAVVDYVRQAEAGVKFRQDALVLNLTGFLANTLEHNIFFGTVINRNYRAYGFEFEGEYHSGGFDLFTGAIYTKAKIVSDLVNPAVNGNVPQRQPELVVTVTPQYRIGRFEVGGNVIATTSSYALDTQQLKIPGYTTVNGFVQFRPTERLTLSLNAKNLFNVLGVNFVGTTGTVQAGTIVNAAAINGRSVQASARLAF
jgi:outer membrane receptor protein involved in Fe transport